MGMAMIRKILNIPTPSFLQRWLEGLLHNLLLARSSLQSGRAGWAKTHQNKFKDLIASILNSGQGAAALRTIELDQRLGGTPVQVPAHCHMLVGFPATLIYWNWQWSKLFVNCIVLGARGAGQGANTLHRHVWRQDDRFPGAHDHQHFLWEHVSCPREGMLPPLMEKKVKTLGSLIPISFRFVM